MDDYYTIIGENAWMYNQPININAYDPTVSNATVEVRAVKEAEKKKKITALKTFNVACTVPKDLIIYGVGEDAVVSIKQQYVGYGGTDQRK